MAGLQEVQDILGDLILKLKEAKDVSWLSHNAAVQTLRRTLPSVVASFEREAAERGEPTALGLAKMVKTYDFVASLIYFRIYCHISVGFHLFSSNKKWILHSYSPRSKQHLPVSPHTRIIQLQASANWMKT